MVMRNIMSTVVLTALISNANAIEHADVLGRDLKLPGATWAGHVGIAYAPLFSEEPYLVFEALNAEKAIQLNTIEKFKSSSNYWGSRTGISENNDRTRWILTTAYRQSKLCTEYTYFPQYKVATVDECGKFRCDTFVNYVYWQAGITLPTHNSALSIPRRVYNSFPYESSITKVSLRDLNDDELMQKLQTDATPLTKDEKDYIWEKINSPQTSDLHKELYIDLLGTIGDPDLIPEFMKLYEKSTNIKIKTMLLRSIGDLAKRFPDKNLIVEFYTSSLYDNLAAIGAATAIRNLALYSDESHIFNHFNLINANLDKIDQQVALLITERLSKVSPALNQIYRNL
jgi:hypothetical protein